MEERVKKRTKENQNPNWRGKKKKRKTRKWRRELEEGNKMEN
jgi:hypothetical protein